MHHPPEGKAIRALLSLVVAGALAAACGDDDNASDTTTTTEAEETTTTEADEEETTTTDDGSDGEGACSLLDPADLEEVTGVAYEVQSEDETSCVYQASSGAAIALNVADVSGAEEAGLEGARSTCEDGTAEDITLPTASGAFTCLVTGIPTVAAAGEGVLVVLTGDDPDEAVEDATILDALVQILENALASA